MSNIDQAFINAYSDQDAVKSAPQSRTAIPPRPPAAPGPTLRVFAHGADATETRIDRGAPAIAQPHFRAPAERAPSDDPYVAIAQQQQATFAENEELTLPSRVGNRQPLSAFATPREAPNTAFRPVFEVDEFRWPAITDELFRSTQKLLRPVVDSIVAAASEGRSLMGIAGTNSGVGSSTVTLCLARAIAAAGHSLAVVDANFASAALATSLGLEFEAGWEDVLAGQMPLAECAVISLADKMTLIPLCDPSPNINGRLSSIQSSVIAGMLRYHHDVVLFDLGAANDSVQLAAMQSIIEHCRLDVGIIVAPTGAKDVVTLHGIDQLSSLFGPLCLGVIGNQAG